MGHYYYEEDEGAWPFIKAGIIVFLVIIVIYAVVAVFAGWCLIKSIAFYCKAIKYNVSKDYNGNYTFGKGFSDLGNTIKSYWEQVVEFSNECFYKKFFYKVLGVLMYPLGFVFFLVWTILHLLIMLICCFFSSIYILIAGKN